jgi:hypothetical protein
MNKELEVGDLIMFDGIDVGLVSREPYRMFRGPVVVDVMWSGKNDVAIMDYCAYIKGAAKLINSAR